MLPLSTPLRASLRPRGGDGVGVGAVCSLSAQLPLPYGLVSVPSSHKRRDAVGPPTPTLPLPPGTFYLWFGPGVESPRGSCKDRF